jgi:hypothetical protein
MLLPAALDVRNGHYFRKDVRGDNGFDRNACAC